MRSSKEGRPFALAGEVGVKASIKAKRLQAGWNEGYLAKVLSS